MNIKILVTGILALCVSGIAQADARMMMNHSHRLLIGNLFSGVWHTDCQITPNGYQSYVVRYHVNPDNERKIIIRTTYFNDDHCYQDFHHEINTFTYQLSGLADDNIGDKYYILTLKNAQTSQYRYFSTADNHSDTEGAFQIKHHLDDNTSLIVMAEEK